MTDRTVTNHGRSGYKAGCRCDVCRCANNDYMREYQRRRYAAGKASGAKATFECQRCGTSFVSMTRYKPKYCSIECQHASRQQAANEATRERYKGRRHAKRARQRRNAAQRRLHMAKAGTTGTTIRADITCLVCDTHFLATWWGRSTNRACSEACEEQLRSDRKRDGKHRRRARQRSAYVAPVSRTAIYTRDKWICGICHRAIPKGISVPHPMAATIDHIVPLSLGGTHEPANVRAAHFQCNSRRGNRGNPEQLALIG